MSSGSASGMTVERLDLVNWHIVRGDQLRANVSARAGTVLSTNALVLAGVTFLVTLGGTPGRLVVAIAACTLLGVVVSVITATLALMTIRPYRSQFGDEEAASPFLYSYAGVTGTMEYRDFGRRLRELTDDDLLEHALVELWRCARIHRYRYHRLRIATACLVVALVLFLLDLLIVML